jgi:hypothetical protein
MKNSGDALKQSASLANIVWHPPRIRYLSAKERFWPRCSISVCSIKWRETPAAMRAWRMRASGIDYLRVSKNRKSLPHLNATLLTTSRQEHEAVKLYDQISDQITLEVNR